MQFIQFYAINFKFATYNLRIPIYQSHLIKKLANLRYMFHLKIV